MRIFRLKNLLFILIFSQVIIYGQNGDSVYIASHFTKYEYRIPMRDGVKLFTIVYSPKDSSEKYPILFTRTPYDISPYGISDYPDSIGPSRYFTQEKYIYIYQDVRGRFMSEGKYEDVRPYIPNKKPDETDESSDVYDTIDWLIKHLKSNGRVGMYGISYPGFYTVMGAIDAHPALAAVSPQAPIADWFIDDDFHRHGAFWLPHAFAFYSVFGIQIDSLYKDWPQPVFDPGTNDGYNFFLRVGPFKNTNEKYLKHRIPFWDTVMAHPNYDSFWQKRNTLPNLKNINPAVLTVGGWFDAEDLYGALNTYKSIEEKNKNINNRIVMGPWFHGGWERSKGDHLGDITFGSSTSDFYQKNIELPFFNYYLKSKMEDSLNLPEAYMFETGTNVWKKYDQWPPANVEKKSIYIHDNGKLSFSIPVKKEVNFDSYISDPSKPVPYTQKITYSMIREYMTEDQRFAASRPDVLVYSSDPLQNNITLAGPITADLFVSTSGTDADFILKLIDDLPDSTKNNEPNPCNVQLGGYEMMVRGEIMRGKYRNSFENPQPFKPGKVTEVKFTIPDINHTFMKNHKIMIQIQSTWFPLADLNPQKFVNIYKADEKDFKKAEIKIYHTPEYPSKIEIGVLK